ncbi:hypothetical protein BCY91_10425 [Pelobium manganitolerans]|uniref:DUF4403 domain-containing protein n=1 Tax=Pelobium manganitolerans TaxID=1842495 RepID=A0A419S2L4_9SPHI|nr:DUF4403 family protein [Pelobium manganitolerans]RKD13228.1 hypothetical protein BCY91_10425 [Pelobium manganitolerans]
MNNRKSLPLLLIAGFYLSSCSTSKQVQALKPLPDYSSTEVVYEKQLSFINMPVEVAVKDLQIQSNKYLNGLIYDDNSFDGDNLVMKVYKASNIVISEQKGRILMDIPLKIVGKVKYGVQSFGVDLTDVKDFNLNGIVRLNSAVGLKDWKITTATTIQNVSWKESPTVTVAGKAIPITYLINPAISVFKPTLAKLVDDAIAQSLDIKPYVLDALENFSQPTKVNDEYETWFAMQPVEIYASKATLANQKITVNMGLKTYLETAIGRKPAIVFNRDAIALKSVDKMPNQFNANVAAFAPYSYASSVITKNFAGQKFESGKRSVTVNKVDVWGKEGKMIVALNLSGSVNGDFYLTGVPAYDAATKEIYLDQVDFVLDSKSKLLKAGDWLVHGLIVKKMADACRFSIASQLADGEKTMASYLNNYQPIKGVKVNGKLNGITPNKVILTPNAIVAMVVANGQVAVTIDGME